MYTLSVGAIFMMIIFPHLTFLFSVFFAAFITRFGFTLHSSQFLRLTHIYVSLKIQLNTRLNNDDDDVERDRIEIDLRDDKCET